MGERSESLRLTDIAEAIELINSEMSGVTLQAFETDTRKRWLVEPQMTIIFPRPVATFRRPSTRAFNREETPLSVIVTIPKHQS